MPLQRTETPVLLALPVNLPKIFDQVQVSAANHQKNFVALSKIHNAAAQVTETTKNGVDVQLSGEKAFEDLFIEMIIRILPVKKGASVVDRVVKFVAGYMRFIGEKGARRNGNHENATDNYIKSDKRKTSMKTKRRLLLASFCVSSAISSKVSKPRTRTFAFEYSKYYRKLFQPSTL